VLGKDRGARSCNSYKATIEILAGSRWGAKSSGQIPHSHSRSDDKSVPDLLADQCSCLESFVRTWAPNLEEIQRCSDAASFLNHSAQSTVYARLTTESLATAKSGKSAEA